MKVYKFNGCYLDTIKRRVFKNGQLIEMTSRAFDVLLLLVESGGKTVTKDDLIHKVWHDQFVEEGNIPVHISKLRKTLGASKSEPFIETISGVGYQFVSHVNEITEAEWKKYLSQYEKTAKTGLTGTSNLDSIAVLPFQNASENNEMEYLAEGLTENLINNLSYIPEIKVLARNTVFRFKDSLMEAQEIGSTLDVATVLTGRVKMIKENIVVGVELIRVSDGVQLWGKQFNQPFSDIFEIQEKIADSISEILRLQFNEISQKFVQGQMPHDIKAYNLYLKGRHFWSKLDIVDVNLAIKYFQESIAADPGYIAAYIGLADCYTTLYQLTHISRDQALTLINPIVNRVAEFDENAPETLAMVGFFKLMFEWDWKNSEICYQRSLALNPNNMIVRFRYANLLGMCKRFSEALTQLRQGLLLDPLSIVINTNLGKLFLLMEQHDNAISQLEATLELDTKNYLTPLLLGVALAEKKRFSEALEIFEASHNSRMSVEVLSLIAYIKALAGNEEHARQILEEIEAQAKLNYIEANNLAYIYIALGETERALDHLEVAYQQRCPDLLSIQVDPRLKPLRGHTRFKDLVRQVFSTK